MKFSLLIIATLLLSGCNIKTVPNHDSYCEKIMVENIQCVVCAWGGSVSCNWNSK